MTHDTTPLTSGSSGGLERRTLVAGAAWTIPVIATTIGAPLAAASTTAPTLSLAFVNAPYYSATCAALGDITLAVADQDGVPVSGETVTVSLPDGLHWTDGSTTPRTFGPTDASGRITLSGIIAPSSAGSHTISATTAGTAAVAPATAVAPVTVAARGAAYNLRYNGGSPLVVQLPYVPFDSKPIGYNAFIGSDGTLWMNSQPISRGVVDGTLDSTASNVTFLASDGTARIARYNSGAPIVQTFTTVPLNSTPLSYNTFLAPDKTLWMNGTFIASEVSGTTRTNTTDATSFTDTSGRAFNVRYNGGNPLVVQQPGVPLHSTPIGYNSFLAPDGGLWMNSQQVAMGVAQAVTGEGDKISYVGTDGVARLVRYNGGRPQISAYSNVPTGSSVVGYNSFLSADHDLYVNNQFMVGDVIASSTQNTGDGLGLIRQTEGC